MKYLIGTQRIWLDHWNGRHDIVVLLLRTDYLPFDFWDFMSSFWSSRTNGTLCFSIVMPVIFDTLYSWPWAMGCHHREKCTRLLWGNI